MRNGFTPVVVIVAVVVAIVVGIAARQLIVRTSPHVPAAVKREAGGLKESGLEGSGQAERRVETGGATHGGGVSQPVPPPARQTENPSRSETKLAYLARRLREIGIPCTPPNPNEYTTGTSFLIDPADSRTLYVSVRYKGIFKSTDGGASWRKVTAGLFAYPDQSNLNRPCHQGVGDAVIDPKNPKRLLITWLDVNNGTIREPYSETAGLWESTDGGESWHQALQDWMNAGPGGALALDPTNPATVYFGVDNTPASYREADPTRYLNTKGALYKTTDGGAAWAELPTGLLDGFHALEVFVNPRRPEELILFTNTHRHVYTDQGAIEVPSAEYLGPVLRSGDGGQSWLALGRLPAGYELLVEGDVSKNQFNHIFVTPFILNSAAEQRSFYSTDSGATFRASSMYIQVARYDPFDLTGQRLLGVTVYGPPKLLESRDAGATWREWGNLPAEARESRLTISQITWDREDAQTLYVSGGGGFVWRSRDAGKTWHAILRLEQLKDF